MYIVPKGLDDPLTCALCEQTFKDEAAIKKHQGRKSCCVPGDKVFEYLSKKIAEWKEFVERMEMSEEHSDMFRKLHVRSQKQLAAWRKDHEKCNVTLRQEAEKEDPEAFTLEDKPRESFFKKESVKSNDNAFPIKTAAAPSNIRAPNNSFFNDNSGNDGNDSNVSWSSRRNSNGSTTTTTTTTSTSEDNVVPDWAKQFQKAPWTQNNGALQPTTLPNGQVINPANMTTTNTTTTNVTNNIININVKLCAPGFESINMGDSRGFNYSAEKKQEIADHLQKLLEIMMDDEPSFSHYDYGDHDYKKEIYPDAMS